MFHPVQDYYRQEHFDFFRDFGSPFYAVTFRLRITKLKALLNQRQCPVFLNLCYVVTRAMHEIEDFRYRWVDDQIVLYDRIDLGTTAPGGDAFRFDQYEYDADFDTFNAAAAARAQSDAPLQKASHAGYAFFTAIPGIAFTGLTHPTYADKMRAQPQTAFGKFETDDKGELWVPVGMQVNHIFIDGKPLNRLIECIEDLCDSDL